MSAGSSDARPPAQRGQSTIEFAGSLFLMLLAALCAWQLALVGWTAVSAGNAVRSAARTWSRGGDGAAAGQTALASKLLNDGAVVTMDPNTDQWKVVVPIPIVFPGLDPVQPPPTITELASMPHTG